MPGAAAERRVVDAAVPVGRCARAGRAPARRAARRRAPGRAATASSGPVEVLGEDREDVDAHDRQSSSRPSGGSIDHDAVARARPRTPSAPARRRRARAGRARGSPRPRRPGRARARRGRRPRRRSARAPRARRRRARGRRRAVGGEHHAEQRLGRGAVVDASKLHEPPALVRARRRDDELAVAGVEHGARRGALGPVAGEA